GSSYRSLFTAAFTAVGITPRITHEIAEWETSIALVEAGVGIGLMPRLVSLESVSDVVRVQIAGAHVPTRRIVAAMRAGSLESPLMRESLSHILDLVRRILGSRFDHES